MLFSAEILVCVWPVALSSRITRPPVSSTIGKIADESPCVARMTQDESAATKPLAVSSPTAFCHSRTAAMTTSETAAGAKPAIHAGSPSCKYVLAPMPASVMIVNPGSAQKKNASRPPSGPARSSPMDVTTCVDDGPGSADAIESISRKRSSESHFFLTAADARVAQSERARER